MAAKEKKVEPGYSKPESGEATPVAQDEKKGKSGSKLGKLVRSGSFKLGKKEKAKDEVDVGEPGAEGKKKVKKVKKSKKESGDNVGKQSDGGGQEAAKSKPSKASQLVRKLSMGKMYKSSKSLKTPSPTQSSPVLSSDAVTEQEENIPSESSASAGGRQGPEGDDFQSFHDEEEAPVSSPSANTGGQSATADIEPKDRVTTPPVAATAEPAEEQAGAAAVWHDASSETGILSRIPYIEESEELTHVEASQPHFESAEESHVKTELECFDETGSRLELLRDVFPVAEPEDQQITLESRLTQNELSNLGIDNSLSAKVNTKSDFYPETFTESFQETESNLHPEVTYREESNLHPEVTYTEESNLHPEGAYTESNLHPEGAYTESNLHPEVTYTEESNLHPEVKYTEESNLHPEVSDAKESNLHPEVSDAKESNLHPEVNYAEESNLHLEVNYAEESNLHPEVNYAEESNLRLEVNYAEESNLHPEASYSEESNLHPEASYSEESNLHPKASYTEESNLHPTASYAEESNLHPEASYTEESNLHPEASYTEESNLHPEASYTEESNLHPESSYTEESNLHPEASYTEESNLHPEASYTEESNLHSEDNYIDTDFTSQLSQNLQQNQEQEINKVVRFESDSIDRTYLTAEHETSEVADPVVEAIGAENFERAADNADEILKFEKSSAWMSQIPSDHPSKSLSSSVKGKQSVNQAAAKVTKKNLEEDIAKLLEEERLSSERVLRSVEESLDKSTHLANSQESEEIEEFGDNLDKEESEAEYNKRVPSEMPSPSVSIPKDVNAMAQQSGDKREHLYKILVIGELGTGKTSIIKRYVHQFFSQHYRATIGVDFALKVLNWDTNSIIRLQLWDIAGQERFGNMTRVYYKEAVGAFIVFDVTRAATFDAVVKWKQDLDTKVQLPDGSPIPCVLLANKCDQQKEGLVNNAAKMEEYCKEKGFVGWYETSAKENINIEDAAKMLVTKILQNDKLIHQNDTLKDSDKFSIDGKNSSEKSGKSCSC